MQLPRVVPALALAAALSSLAACGSDTAEVAAGASSGGSSGAAADVRVTDGWVRSTSGAKDTSMTGVFLVVHNDGDEPVKVTGISSDAARAGELHRMVVRDGELVMQEMPAGLEVPAGKAAHLEPGFDHGMLLGLQEPLLAGDEVRVTLELEDGSTEELTLPVKEFAEEEGGYDHEHADGQQPGDGHGHGDDTGS